MTATEEQNKEKLVSIVIATYNAGKSLQGCLASINRQQYPHIEIVVVDGGSTDDTISILKNHQGKPLNWISEPDNGIYDALNKGIGLAKGSWLHFLGADDRLLDGFSTLANKLEGDRNVFYGNTEEFIPQGVKPDFIILTGEFSTYRLAKYCLNHQAIIYPKKAFANRRYDTKYKVLADYAFNIWLWGNTRFKKRYYPISVASYNMGGFSSFTTDTEFMKDKPSLIRKHMGIVTYLRYALKLVKRRARGESDA